MALPQGTPIKEISWEQLNASRHQIRGWVYPRLDVSQTIPGFHPGQRAALSFYIVMAGIMFIAGLVMPFFLGSWWWLLLVPGAVVVWRANRKSMEQFFLQNLKENQAFYDVIRQSSMGEEVKVVFKGDQAF